MRASGSELHLIGTVTDALQASLLLLLLLSELAQPGSSRTHLPGALGGEDGALLPRRGHIADHSRDTARSHRDVAGRLMGASHGGLSSRHGRVASVVHGLECPRHASRQPLSGDALGWRRTGGTASFQLPVTDELVPYNVRNQEFQGYGRVPKFRRPARRPGR
jgi:hypothetical protein